MTTEKIPVCKHALTERQKQLLEIKFLVIMILLLITKEISIYEKVNSTPFSKCVKCLHTMFTYKLSPVGRVHKNYIIVIPSQICTSSRFLNSVLLTEIHPDLSLKFQCPGLPVGLVPTFTYT